MATAQEQAPTALTLIRGSKDEAECSCGESDVYDGYAVCVVHPDGN